MRLKRPMISILNLAAVMAGVGSASAQTYPSKPIRIVTSGVGGSGDFTARLMAQGIASGLGQQVIVENRAAGGGSGVIVSQAQPDGYTLLINGGSLWIGTLIEKTPYDVLKDFAPITLVNRQPNVLVVNAAVPAKSVKELIALTKARPGELNYSTGALGSASHLSAELFKSMAGVNIVRISYKAAGLRVTALLSNEVQMEFSSPNSGVQHIKSGKLRARAVTTAQPSALVPGVPTVAASGLPGYESAGMYGFFAPARTPAAIISRLNREAVSVLSREDIKEKFFAASIEAVGSTPQTLTDIIKAEMSRLGKVIKEAGIRAE